MIAAATRASLRRVGVAATAMFVVVLLTIGVQMARGHDPALGTTPRPTAAAVQPAAPVAPDGGQAAPQPPVQYQQPQYPLPQYQQPPAAQTTTS